MSEDDSQLLHKREEFLQTFFRRGAELTDELIRDNARLRERVAVLEGEHKHAVAAQREYEQRAREIEDGYATLATLHVATDQLHAATSARDVLQTTIEILINFVGADSFAIMLLDEPSGTLRVVKAHGLPADLIPPIKRGHGILGEVAESGRPVIGTPVSGATQVPDSPPVAVPLRHGDHVVGAIAVWTLLAHKPDLTGGDRELLDLVGLHAGSALVAARLAAEHPDGVPFAAYERLI